MKASDLTAIERQAEHAHGLAHETAPDLRPLVYALTAIADRLDRLAEGGTGAEFILRDVPGQR